MRWIFGIVGLVIGALGGGTIGAFFGALIGVGLASLILYMDKRASSQWTNPPAGPEGLGPVQAPAPMPGVVPINERVTRLEHEVALLRRQLAQMQGQAFAAPVPEAAAEPAAVPVPEPVVAQALPPAQAPAVPPSAVVPEPVAPRELPPHEPDWVERAVGAARDWLLGGNSVVRVGILILFFGVAFLLKYAADNSLLPIEFRLAGVAVASIVLLGIGWRLRDKRPGYALVLQGGGVGVLYLTVFAATRMVPLLPVGAAFALLVLICALAAGLAVKQNAPALAFTGSAGGFLAPILISTGAGSHVALFSYYALLNAGIFAIAWFRAWRALNLLGFVFTFGIATAWGALRYEPSLLASTEPFLILFFLMYVGIALLYALRRHVSLRHYVDGTVVFGTPLVAMGLQAALVHHIPFAMAWSAAALAAFYLAVAAWLAPKRASLGLLFEAMFALGVIFITLAIPLAFDGRTTSAVWALEGAAVVWVSVRQQRRLALAAGLMLQLAAGVAFGTALLFDWSWSSTLPVLNSRTIGALLKSAAAPAGAVNGNLRFSYDRNNPRAIAAEGKLQGEGIDLTWLAGKPAKLERLDLAADAAGLHVAEATLDWAGQRATLRGETKRTAEGPVFDATIDSPGIVVDALLPEKTTQPSGKKGSLFPLPVSGRIAVRSKFVRYATYNIEPLAATVHLERNRAQLEVTEALVCGLAVPLTLEATPAGYAAKAQVAAQQQKLEETAKCLSQENLLLTGPMDLRVDVRTQGQPDQLLANLSGTVSADVRNGTVMKFALLGNILSMQNVVALAKDGGPKLGADAFPFRQFSAKGHFEKGRFHIDEGVFHSNAIGLGANGWISLTDYQSRLTVLVAPLALVDEAVRKLPLLGYVVGGTFTSLPVGVSGDIRNPTVVPLGPRAITSEMMGLLTRTLSLPGRVVPSTK
jgi:hypothetical protein